MRVPDLTFIQARKFARLSPAGKRKFITQLTDEEASHLRYLWEAWAREKQLEPAGNWTVWLLMCGRGFGKTRVGAEWIRKQAQSYGRLGLIGRTAADVRDVMIEGESGILAISPPWDRPRYEPSKRRLVWPNGAQATTYSADEPDMLRGPQHEKIWMDEPGAWQYEDSYDQAMFGLRLGNRPQAVATTTPRVTRLIKRMVRSQTTHVTTGTTYENRDNLAATFFTEVIKKYEGTRLGRQELEGLLLEDAEGALWRREEMIEAHRVTAMPELVRVVVAIDPAVTAEEGSDETGIVVAGLGVDGQGYVLDDRSLRASPMAWANAAISAYHSRQADRVIGEVNQGGDLIEHTLRMVDANVSYRGVRATRGKLLRAEPVAALYEQGRVHHVGTFPDLEDQMCSWEPGMSKSPDRIDALVYALTELIVDTGPVGGLILPNMQRTEDSEDTGEGWF